MNRAHRVVWNQARQAFVVAHEFAATSGKPSSTKTVIARSVAAAALVIAAGPAAAQTVFMAPGQTINNTTSILGTSGYPGINLGPGTTAGAITNSGTIQGSSGSGEDDQLDGIFVSGTLTGGVTNTGTGTISGNMDGVAIMSGGSVSSVSNAGTITGGNFGVIVGGSSLSGGVTNTGLIHGNTAGVEATGTATVGAIVNTGTLATISGGAFGIEVTAGGSISSISNTGMISGGTGGILVTGTSTLGSIINSGALATISGGSVGIQASNGASIGAITNSGHITGFSDGILLTGGSTITSIVNSGTISNSSTNSGTAILVTGSTITGAISNLAGGVISGATGIGIYGSRLGSLQNAGTITGQFGVDFEQATVSGSITNSGKITSLYDAFEIENTIISGSLVNSGLLSGTSYGGVLLVNATVAGAISNLAGGVITGASAIALYDTRVGSISNAAGATMTGIGGEPFGFGAAVTIYTDSTVTGKLSNSGVMTGANWGVYVSSESAILGGLTNSGKITGGRAGVGLFSGSTIAGGIVNSGLISGTSIAGVYVTSSRITGGITNAAGGTISGPQGVYLDDAAVSAIANAAGAAISGSASNGIDIVSSSITGSVSNAGSIGGHAAGIGIATNATVTGGITNSGTITGATTGIDVTKGGTVLGLADSGVVSGGKYSVFVDPMSSLGSIVISGSNTAAFTGDVYAPLSAATISSGATFTATNAFDVASFSIQPGATLNMNAMASTSGGARGITATGGVNNAGTLSVAYNAASITGNYTQAASGAFSLGASSLSKYGQLSVSGAVSLPSAASIFVNVDALNTFPSKGTLFGVISGSSLTATTFDVTDNSALFGFKGVIDGNAVDLTLKENALVLPDVIATHNNDAIGAARVLDDVIETSGTSGPFGNVIDALGKLQSVNQVSNAASETLPLLSGDSNVAVLGALYDIDHIVQARTDGNYGLSSGDEYLTDRSVWVKPFGSWASQGTQYGAPGFNSQVAGIMLGVDGAWSSAGRAGLAFAYANTDVTGSGQEETFDSDHINLYQFIGYGSYALDARTQINWQIDGGKNTNDGSRTISFVDAIAKSSYDSDTVHAGVGIARAFPLSADTVVTPSVRIDYTWIHDDSYGEGGAGPLSLNVASTSLEQLLTSVNAKLTQRLTDQATLYANIGAGYDSLARESQVTSAYAGAPGLSFSTPGVGTRPWTGFGGIGVVYQAKGGPEITASVDVEQRSGFNEQSVGLKLRWPF